MAWFVMKFPAHVLADSDTNDDDIVKLYATWCPRNEEVNCNTNITDKHNIGWLHFLT